MFFKVIEYDKNLIGNRILKVQYLQILIAFKNKPEYQLNSDNFLLFLNFLTDLSSKNYISDFPFPIIDSEVNFFKTIESFF